MSLQATNLIIQGSQLPATFKGKPNDLFREMLARMRIVSPSGTTTFVVSDTEPSSNQGPWLKNGTEWWVFDPDLKRYVPLDINNSETKWFQVGNTTPTTTNPPLWLKTTSDLTEIAPQGGTPIAWYLFDGTTWVQLPVLLVDRSITKEKLDFTANFFAVAAGVNNYTAVFEPTENFSYGDGITKSFLCFVKFTFANTATSVTLNVNGVGSKPVKKNVNEDLEIGDIAVNSVHQLIFDGTNFQVLTDLAPVGGEILGMKATATSIPSSTTSEIPSDTSKPQLGEGQAIASLQTNFTAKSLTSKLVFELVLFASAAVISGFTVAIFRDNEPDAIAATSESISAGFDTNVILKTVLTPLDTAAHDYKVSYGNTGGGVLVAVNQDSAGTLLYGGLLTSSLTITEISA